MDVVLLWLVRLAAIATIIPSFFMAWYLAGSDDIPRNPVAPFLGLGILVSSVWALIRAFRLPDTADGTLVILALPFLLALIAWPFSGNRAVEREPLWTFLKSAIWLMAPFAFGLLYVLSA